jgi:RND family efflux transporter MFP subunit
VPAAVIVLASAEASLGQSRHAMTAAPAEPMDEALRGDPAGEIVRVVIRSYETAAISAELNARITYLPRREGDRFRKGEVIVTFDCRRIVAEHDAALAALRFQQAAYETQRELMHYRATGTLAVDQSRFETEKAEAEVRGLEAKREACTVRAPFDGRVVEKVAQVHEVAQPNQPLLRIINEERIELVMMVPSSWMSRLANGTAFTVRIDENGETHRARIVQSTGAIDPVSQSARLIGELVDPPRGIVPGMSGTARFDRREARE